VVLDRQLFYLPYRTPYERRAQKGRRRKRGWREDQRSCKISKNRKVVLACPLYQIGKTGPAYEKEETLIAKY
jgi:hypothetical protein